MQKSLPEVRRTVVCADALEWIKNYNTQELTSYVASLPDISEFPSYSLVEWQNWFVETARLILQATSENGVSIFFQSDIKHEGHWIDKAYLCQKAAELCGSKLLWHKIICKAPPGQTTFGKPAYSHILCFSKNLKLDVAQSTPDVIDEMGDKTWVRGMGLNVCKLIAEFIHQTTPESTVINPFCGEGGLLAVLEISGITCTGIERSPKRAERARLVTVNNDLTRWMNTRYKNNE